MPPRKPTLLPAVLLLLLPACGGSEAAPPMDPGPEELQAWLGESPAPDSLAVLVEPLARPGDGHALFVSEAELARRYLEPAAGERVVRLHLRGPGRLLQEGGEVVLDDGSVLRSYGPPPRTLGRRARVWWQAVAAGGPAPDVDAAAARRSFLVHGPAAAGAAPRRWQGRELDVELAARTWGEAERLAWLESQEEPAAAGAEEAGAVAAGAGEDAGD